MGEIVYLLKKLIMYVLLFPMRLLPIVNNRIVFFNCLGNKFGDNPKYILEWLLGKYGNKFELVYATNNEKDRNLLKSKNVMVVKYPSLKYFYNVMTCNVFITNGGGYSYMPMRKQQHIVNTWHGGGAYKINLVDPKGISILARKDLLLSIKPGLVHLSTTKRFSESFNKYRYIPMEQFWEIGMPRNDILLNHNQRLIEQIKVKLGLKISDKLVLFAPTFRPPHGRVENLKYASIDYGLDIEVLLDSLKKRFDGEWKFGFRFHPNIKNRYRLFSHIDVIDLSDYEDMQELLLVADVLINDFSSSMWDFMLTGKPCFLFAKDLRNYIETTKVFTPVESWPFSKAKTNEELKNNILTFDEDKYSAACRKHYKDLGGCETGKATELVGEQIYRWCNN